MEALQINRDRHRHADAPDAKRCPDLGNGRTHHYARPLMRTCQHRHRLSLALAALRKEPTGPERDRELRKIIDIAQDGCPLALHHILNHVRASKIAERSARSVLIDATDVDDAVQQTLVVCAEKLSRRGVSGAYSGRGPFEAWVRRIARNQANGIIRKRSRRNESTGEGEWEELRSLERLSSLLARQDLLHRGLEQLTPDHREVIHLRGEGLAYADIATLLQLPINTVKTRLLRARAHLAESIFGEDADRQS